MRRFLLQYLEGEDNLPGLNLFGEHPMRRQEEHVIHLSDPSRLLPLSVNVAWAEDRTAGIPGARGGSQLPSGYLWPAER